MTLTLTYAIRMTRLRSVFNDTMIVQYCYDKTHALEQLKGWEDHATPGCVFSIEPCSKKAVI